MANEQKSVENLAEKNASRVFAKKKAKTTVVDPWMVAKVIRSSELGQIQGEEGGGEGEAAVKTIQPAGIRPSGGRLVKPDDAPLAMGLTLEQAASLLEAGVSEFPPRREVALQIEKQKHAEIEETKQQIAERNELDAVLAGENVVLGDIEAPEALEIDEKPPEEEPPLFPLYRPKRPSYQNDLQFAQDLAMIDPKLVAWSIKEWINPKS